ncbi:MAG: DNA polymerase thumb domain-containing protein, partial [Achromobacter sp.]
PLPVRKVPGVGKVTQARLEQLGIHTVGDLATHSAEELEHYFGRYGRRLYELARGIDEREVQTDQPLQQVSAETTFSEDIRLDALGEAIDRMADRVWDQALKKGALGRTVVLKLKTDRFRILTRSQTSPNPPGSAAELAAVARLLCERVELPPETLYRLAGVGMSNFADPAEQARQPDLFGGAF